LNRPAVEVIREQHAPDILNYADPPYLHANDRRRHRARPMNSAYWPFDATECRAANRFRWR
jgi:hypothetical protein